MRLGPIDKRASLGGFRLGLFGLAASGEALLLAPIMRISLQFIVLTGVAVEVDDFLFGFPILDMHLHQFVIDGTKRLSSGS